MICESCFDQRRCCQDSARRIASRIGTQVRVRYFEVQLRQTIDGVPRVGMGAVHRLVTWAESIISAEIDYPHLIDEIRYKSHSGAMWDGEKDNICCFGNRFRVSVYKPQVIKSF